MRLPFSLYKKVINFILSIQNNDDQKLDINDQYIRQALILNTNLDIELKGQISVNIPAVQFVHNLVGKLIQYGTLKDGRNPIEAILESAKDFVSNRREDEYNTIIQELHSENIIEEQGLVLFLSQKRGSSIKFSPTLYEKIVTFLASLPNMGDQDNQRSLIFSAGLDDRLQNKIRFDLPYAQFFILLVDTLIAYGDLDDERHALVAVLEAAQNYTGREGQAYCETLIQSLNVEGIKKDDNLELSFLLQDDADLSLPADLYKKLVKFLSSLPSVDALNGQKTILYSAGIFDTQIFNQLTFGASSSQFFALLVPKLVKYGKLQDGRETLVALLQVAREDYVGGAKIIECDLLIQELQVALEQLDPIRTKKQQSEDSQTFFHFIEFPPEYHQAGISILSYFATVLHQKYHDIKVKVKIEQDQLKVRMIIETEDGFQEQIDRTLTEYGLVITGKMKPEELLPNPLYIMELKNQLRVAQYQIESKKELLAFANKNIDGLTFQVQQLTAIVGQAIQSTGKPISITLSTEQHVQQSQHNQQEGGQIMGDNYLNQGQAGAMGRDAQAYNNVFQHVNLSSLADELARLKAEMQKQAHSSEQHISAEEVSHAESAVRKGEKSKVVGHLKKAGQWALNCAKEIGTDVASEVIKKSMGL